MAGNHPEPVGLIAHSPVDPLSQQIGGPPDYPATFVVMDQMITMGMDEGMAAALRQADEVLAR